MRRHNVSIAVSVLISAFVISVLCYFQFNPLLQLYEGSRKNMAEDIMVYKPMTAEQINIITTMKGVKSVGFKEEPIAVKLKDNLLHLTQSNADYLQMKYKFIKQGELPETETDVIISDITADKFDISIDDMLDFNVGNRTLRGEVIDPERKALPSEVFNTQSTVTLNVVGIYHAENTAENQEMYSLINNAQELYYPCIKLDSIFDVNRVSQQLTQAFGASTVLIKHERLSSIFSIDDRGFNVVRMFMNIFLLPILLILVFTMMITNIFKVWAIYPIKTLSMYKSIGASDHQILNLLIKEAYKISFVPLLIGEFAALIVLHFLQNKMNVLRITYYSNANLQSPLNLTLIVGIAFMMLIIIGLSVLLPARMVAKVSIIDGIKGDLSFGKNKKKRSHNWETELSLNNRRHLNPQFIILTLGIILIMTLVGIGAVNAYNEKLSADKPDYDITLRYHTGALAYPQIFSWFVEDLKPKSHMITMSKQIFIDMKSLNYSKEFSAIGYDEAFDEFYFQQKNNLVYGVIIGIDDDVFKHISSHPDDIVLINRVQRNPFAFYEDLTYIPYVSKDTESIDYKFLEEFETQTLNISQVLKQPIEGIAPVDKYQVQLVTSLTHFKKLMIDAERVFAKHDVELPTLFYQLDLNFERQSIDDIATYIEDTMSNHINATEKYRVFNAVKSHAYKQQTNHLMIGIFVLILLAAIFLSIVNAYTSTQLSFFTRQREFAMLRSIGMEDEKLRKILMRALLKRILFALIMASVVAFMVIALLINSIGYIDIVSYIPLIRFDVMIVSVLCPCFASYYIYRKAIKTTLNTTIIDTLGNI